MYRLWANAIEALKEKLSPTAKVLREGKQKKINARKLVPGDIVILQMGDVVPADVKLLHGQHISIDGMGICFSLVAAFECSKGYHLQDNG